MSTCSVEALERQIEAASASAARLLGVSVTSIDAIGGGRNSRVYRVRGADGFLYALKVYFRHRCETRDRQQAEYQALARLWESGVRQIPRPVAADPREGIALYEYVDGQQVPPDAISAADIDSAVDFLCRLNALARHPGLDDLPNASEACFFGDQLVENIQSRLRALSQAQEEDDAQAGLASFLQERFVPAMEQIVAWGRRHLPFDRVLPRSRQTLSPSDFGFHNALRRPSGQWVFLDFEHFGWDDPAKMLADFLLHPAMTLSLEHKRRFVGDMIAQLGDDPQLAGRLRCLYPLFGLKWCMILLNEFLPEHLSRREFASGLADDRRVIRQQQLLKSESKLRQVCAEYERFPYFD